MLGETSRWKNECMHDFKFDCLTGIKTSVTRSFDFAQMRNKNTSISASYQDFPIPLAVKDNWSVFMFSSLLLRNLYHPLQLIFRPPASLPYASPVKGDNGQVFSNHDQSHLYCYLEELVCQRQPQREKHSPGLGLRIRCVTGRRGHDGVMTGLMGDPQQKGIKGPRRKNSAWRAATTQKKPFSSFCFSFYTLLRSMSCGWRAPETSQPHPVYFWANDSTALEELRLLCIC